MTGTTDVLMYLRCAQISFNAMAGHFPNEMSKFTPV